MLVNSRLMRQSAPVHKKELLLGVSGPLMNYDDVGELPHAFPAGKQKLPNVAPVQLRPQPVRDEWTGGGARGGKEMDLEALGHLNGIVFRISIRTRAPYERRELPGGP